jgi:indole-3-glycerol phosphate synthase
VSLATTPRRRGESVVRTIAERRAADLREQLDGTSRQAMARAALMAAPPRDLLGRLAQPGLHVIAEVKRRSPSAGSLAAPRSVIDQARAYEAGGAAAISVLCEPHWFDGSLDDLRAVRDAVRVPLLAKEFVVDHRQLAVLRGAGADLVLLLAVLHNARALRSLVREARSLGLEPLVEAHDERELERALSSDARLIGINNRDLHTLAIDERRAERLRHLVPDDRLAVAESAIREPAAIVRLRALGYDAALIGEALMRSPDPSAAVASFVAAGRQRDDLGRTRPPGGGQDLRHHPRRRPARGHPRRRPLRRPERGPGHAPRARGGRCARPGHAGPLGPRTGAGGAGHGRR